MISFFSQLNGFCLVGIIKVDFSFVSSEGRFRVNYPWSVAEGRSVIVTMV